MVLKGGYDKAKHEFFQLPFTQEVLKLFGVVLRNDGPISFEFREIDNGQRETKREVFALFRMGNMKWFIDDDDLHYVSTWKRMTSRR